MDSKLSEEVREYMSKIGKKGAAALTSEQRSEIAKKREAAKRARKAKNA